MTYDEREALIEAMAIHFIRPKTNLRRLADTDRSLWSELVREFYRVHPDWTVVGWRSRPAPPRVPITGGLQLANPGVSEDTAWAIGCWGAAVLVFLIVCGLYRTMAGP